MSVSAAIIPIALTILVGWVARRSGVVAKEAWPGVETLSFRVLIPAILIHAIGGADLNPSEIGRLSFALVGTVAVIGMLALATRFMALPLQLTGSSRSTLFQTSTRWNAFISLAAADILAGAEGVLLMAVAMAVLVPIVNVSNILVVARLVSANTSWKHLFRTVATNPLVIACAIGLVVNLGFGGLPETLATGFEIVGRAALGVGLLAVGAGIEVQRFVKASARVVVGVFLRPVLAPAIFLLIGLPLGLNAAELTTGVLATAVPAATNGYIVARAMGGDAELYADILAWQTLLTLVALPFYLSIVATL